MPQGILVITEQRGGGLKNVNLEVIGEAQRLSDACGLGFSIFVLGHKMETITKSLLNYGADEIFVADSEILKEYNSQVYVHVLADTVAGKKSVAIFLPATAMGKDLGPGWQLGWEGHTSLTVFGLVWPIFCWRLDGLCMGARL